MKINVSFTIHFCFDEYSHNLNALAQSVGPIEFTDCISAEE